MNQKLPALKVRMFGRPGITYGNHSVLSGKNITTKMQQLLFLLLYSGPEGIGRGRLVEALYGREEILDTTNNLNVTIYRLKKFLLGGGYSGVGIYHHQKGNLPLVLSYAYGGGCPCVPGSN